MRRTMPILFCFFCLAFLGIRVCLVFARPLTTAKIVFSANREGNRDIYLMNPDGSQQVNITNHGADDISPAWSPTGEQILFASDRDRFRGSWDLYLMDPHGESVQPVFGRSADRSAPTWSPDGKQIAYRRREQGQQFIYIARIDRKNEERVAIGGSPAWSPDGTEIAFVVKAGVERWEIHILNVQTRKQKVFFPPEAVPSWVRGPAWSPKGDKLAFSWLHRVPLGDFRETETIYTVNRDGTRLTQLLDDAAPTEVSPIWSPRGNELLYIKADDPQAIHLQIFKMAFGGGPPEQLTHVGFGHHLGDWFDPAYALPVSPRPQLLTTVWGSLKQE